MSTLAEWLENIFDGLGAHAKVFTSYGATTVALLSTLDKDDVEMLTATSTPRAPRAHGIRGFIPI